MLDKSGGSLTTLPPWWTGLPLWSRVVAPFYYGQTSEVVRFCLKCSYLPTGWHFRVPVIVTDNCGTNKKKEASLWWKWLISVLLILSVVRWLWLDHCQIVKLFISAPNVLTGLWMTRANLPCRMSLITWWVKHTCKKAVRVALWEHASTS